MFEILNRPCLPSGSLNCRGHLWWCWDNAQRASKKGGSTFTQAFLSFHLNFVVTGILCHWRQVHFQAPQGIAQSILKDLRQEDHEWNQDERFMPRDLKSETALHQQDGNYSTESWIAHRVSRLSQELAAVVGFPATARKHVQAAVHEANP